ncbi:MAG: hypothetical protein LBV67_04230 [Streptococcaceae bacterium]|nr:hypothetical protein [Streptococcaceae bacterium]
MNNIVPTPNFIIESRKIEDKTIVVLTVFKGADLPYAYDGKFYRRVDTSTVAADGTTLRRWMNEQNTYRFDEKITNEENLEFNYLASQLIQVTGAKEFNENSLFMLGFKQGSKFTNAGMLFSDTNNFLFGVDTVRYGKSKSDFIKRKRLIGVSILKQFDETIDFFKEYYHDYESVVGTKREKRIMIPLAAFREALANAIVHRDYRLPRNIQIEFFEDKVVITSPGGLPEGMTKEIYLNQNVSSLRNPTLAMVFLRLGIIESFGTGVERIRESYQNFSERPVFDIDEASIRMTLPLIDYARKSNELKELRKDTILEILQKGPLSRSEIETQLQIGSTWTKKTLNDLISINKIERIGRGKTTKYKLFDK